jgi:hypothetical protein
VTYKVNRSDRVRVEIENFDGSKRVDIKYQVAELDVYEDITKKAVLAEVIVYDALDIIQEFPIIGEEDATIEFSYSSSEDRVKLKMRLYEVVDITRDGNDAAQTYKLSFASHELFTNIQSCVEDGYNQLTISEIVKRIHRDHLKTTKRLVLEETSGRYSWASTGDTVFETITKLKDYAWNSNRHTLYMFWEDVNRYNFRSLESLFTQEPKYTYNYNIQNTSIGNPQTEPDNAFSIINLDVMKMVDLIESMNRGMLASSLEEIDVIGKRLNTSNYEYQRQFNDSKHINKHPVFMRQYAEGLREFTTYSTDELPKNNQFHRLHRTSLQAQLNTHVIEIGVPGDHTVRPGDIVRLQVPTAAKIGNLPGMSRLLTGNYLVTKVRNKINGDEYHTYLQVVKDSVERKIKPIV